MVSQFDIDGDEDHERGGINAAFDRLAVAFDANEEIRPFIVALAESVGSKELSSISSLQLGRAVGRLWEAVVGLEKNKPQILVELLDLQPIAKGIEVSNASVVAAVSDVAYLIDTFTEVIARHGYHTSFLTHPLVPVEALGGLGLPNLPTDAPLSLFYAELEEGIGEEDLEVLRRELSQAYRELEIYERGGEAMRSRFGELCHSLSGLSYLGPELIVGSLGLSNFLPLTYLRISDGVVEDLFGWETPEVREHFVGPLGLEAPLYGGEGVELTLGVSDLISPIIRSCRIRYLRFSVQSTGEDHVFLGIFVPVGLPRSIDEIPHLRRKMRSVVETLGLSEASYSYRSAYGFVGTLSVDELVSLSVSELQDLVVAALSVEELPRVRLVSGATSALGASSSRMFVMMPTSRYSDELQRKLWEMLATSFGTTEIELSVVAAAPRRTVVSYLLTNLGHLPTPELIADLEEAIDQVSLPWDETLRLALIGQVGQARGQDLFQRYHRSFEASYADDFSPSDGASDICAFDDLVRRGETMAVHLSVEGDQDGLSGGLRLHILKRGRWMMLSEILPVVEHFGFKVVDELPYEFDLGGDEAWVFDLGLRPSDLGSPLNLDATALERARQAMVQIWSQGGEDDILNSLVISSDLGYGEIELLRSYAAYLRFSTLGYSEPYIRQALVDNPRAARALVGMFRARFGVEGSTGDVIASSNELVEAISEVVSLDQDKILRGLGALISSTVRTNFFAEGRGDGISFKFAPTEATALPKPLPHFEIYYRSSSTEAVHLRGGLVARGGIRWSDRTEDFRTEILGLMKAQGVKNSVIVPVGAKGGFIVRDLPRAREEILPKVRESYAEFIRALFGLTDNIVDSEVVHPRGVAMVDEDDPYLVVAADKGTATFSDLANEIAGSVGYWLGDAFASGGSAGYDHKKMGITAKGAWRSVAHHFGSLGIDANVDEIVTVGIGDMSGDVFGNAMLLSPSIVLIGAFDHRHVFLDPNPDLPSSYAERARLFALERSSWAEYDKAVISVGGGVYSRDSKFISLSDAMAERLGVAAGNYEPSQVIRFLLSAPVDLVWNGGVGTFIKSTTESNVEVSDKANDAIRVNGSEVRAKVIGEGGNLGLTQLARGEYERNGGRCNTDAIDNSAGVDTSDHEVNLKILLHLGETASLYGRDRRDLLLSSVEGEVEAQVLSDNVLQNWVISHAQRTLSNSQTAIVRLTERLIRDADLDCEVEQIPTPQEMRRRFSGDGTLYRSELAVLLAYAKIHLYKELLDSDVLAQPICESYYEAYFPNAIREALPKELVASHPLRREITATQVANALVNSVGLTAVFELCELASVSVARSGAALLAALALIDGPIWHRRLIECTEAEQGLRVQLMARAAGTASRLARWLITSLPLAMTASEAVTEFANDTQSLFSSLETLLDEGGVARLHHETQALVTSGLDGPCARYFGSIEILASLPSILSMAKGSESATPTDAAQLYFGIGSMIGLPMLRSRLGSVAVQGYWEESARELIFISLNDTQADLTKSALSEVVRSEGYEAALQSEGFERWRERNSDPIARMRRAIGTLESEANASLAQLHVISGEIALLARSVLDVGDASI